MVQKNPANFYGGRGDVNERRVRVWDMNIRREGDESLGLVLWLYRSLFSSRMST